MLSDVSLNNSIFIVSFGAAAEQTSIEKLFFMHRSFSKQIFLSSSFHTLSLSHSLACAAYEVQKARTKKFSHYFDSSPLIKMNDARVAEEIFLPFFILTCFAMLMFIWNVIRTIWCWEKWDDKNRREEKVHPPKRRGRMKRGIKLCTVNTWWFSMEIKAVLLKKDLL